MEKKFKNWCYTIEIQGSGTTEALGWVDAMRKLRHHASGDIDTVSDYLIKAEEIPEGSDELESAFEKIFENAFQDPRWVGSDVSFEHCYYVYDKKTNILWYQRNGDRLWDSWDVTPEIVKELEDEVVSVDDLVSFCDIYNEYDTLGKLTCILSYNCDPYGSYQGLKSTHDLKRIIVRRD